MVVEHSCKEINPKMNIRYVGADRTSAAIYNHKISCGYFAYQISATGSIIYVSYRVRLNHLLVARHHHRYGIAQYDINSSEKVSASTHHKRNQSINKHRIFTFLH